MSRIKSQAGISLILVMIGISIISIVLLAVFRLLDMSREMAGSFQSVLKSIDAMQEVRFALADVNTCTFNLQGQVPGSSAHPTELSETLKFPSVGYKTLGSNKAEPLAEIISFGGRGETTVAVKRVTLSLPQASTPNTAMLNIEMEKKAGSSVTRSLRPRSIPIWIKQNAAGAITCCSTRGLNLCP